VAGGGRPRNHPGATGSELPPHSTATVGQNVEYRCARHRHQPAGGWRTASRGPWLAYSGRPRPDGRLVRPAAQTTARVTSICCSSGWGFAGGGAGRAWGPIPGTAVKYPRQPGAVQNCDFSAVVLQAGVDGHPPPKKWDCAADPWTSPRRAVESHKTLVFKARQLPHRSGIPHRERQCSASVGRPSIHALVHDRARPVFAAFPIPRWTDNSFVESGGITRRE